MKSSGRRRRWAVAFLFAFCFLFSVSAVVLTSRCYAEEEQENVTDEEELPDDEKTGDADVESQTEKSEDSSEKGKDVDGEKEKKSDPRDVSYLEDGEKDELYDNLKQSSDDMRKEAKKYAKSMRNKMWEKMQEVGTLPESFVNAYIVVRKSFIPLMLIWFILSILIYLANKTNKKWQRFAIVVFGITLPVITTVIVFGIPYFVAFMK